ncbi:MAG: hypothetical protein BalsKO_19620 [Balneolaceae bacterium]
MKYLFFFFLSILLFPNSAFSQNTIVHDNSDWCDEKNNNRYNSSKEQHCEVREITLEARQNLNVDAGKNGGISIKSWDKNEIQIMAKVSVYARRTDNAQAIADQVTLQTNSKIKADIPSLDRKQNVSVSYRIYVPREIDLDLETYNGGISIRDVDGDIRFGTLNGGVRLTNLNGDVRGKTTNGGVKVELIGSEWIGEGLNVETTNGGVTLYIPEEYNAQLRTGTVNGSMDFDFPMMISGRFDKKLTTTLGDGGKTIRVVTTNGGIRIKRNNYRASFK